MKRVADASRVLLGLVLVVFGLNGFFMFIQPPPLAPRAVAFMQALISTGYMLPFWKGTEVVCGALFLLNLFVPLATVVITPVLLNIAAFHIFLDTRNAAIGLALLGLNTIVMIYNAPKLAPLLRS